MQPGADYKLLGSEPGQPPILKNIIRIERHPQFDIKRLFDHLATAADSAVPMDFLANHPLVETVLSRGETKMRVPMSPPIAFFFVTFVPLW